MIAKTPEDFKGLRAAGKILAGVLEDTAHLVKEGVTTAELDLFVDHTIRGHGAVPSFLNYKPEGAKYPYPAALCVSINDEVVHGIPSEKRILRKGDIVTLDAGLSYNGYFVDAARTLRVGVITEAAGAGEQSLRATDADTKGRNLVIATKEALSAAIGAAKPGKHIGDIGAAIVRVAQKYKLGIVEDLGGHAVGRAVHEKPFIDNHGYEGEGEEIVEGLVLAIEPMLSEGKGAIVLAEDDWTYKMRDRSRAAHEEDTIIITKDGAEIITRL